MEFHINICRVNNCLKYYLIFIDYILQKLIGAMIKSRYTQFDPKLKKCSLKGDTIFKL